jgi:hypothetical protein
MTEAHSSLLFGFCLYPFTFRNHKSLYLYAISTRICPIFFWLLAFFFSQNLVSYPSILITCPNHSRLLPLTLTIRSGILYNSASSCSVRQTKYSTTSKIIFTLKNYTYRTFLKREPSHSRWTSSGQLTNEPTDRPTDQLTPWTWVILEKPTVAQPHKIFQHFVETEGWMPCSQQPTSFPSPEPHESTPHLTPVDFQRTTRHYILQNRTLHNYCENFKSYAIFFSSEYGNTIYKDVTSWRYSSFMESWITNEDEHIERIRFDWFLPLISSHDPRGDSILRFLLPPDLVTPSSSHPIWEWNKWEGTAYPQNRLRKCNVHENGWGSENCTTLFVRDS